MQIDISMNDKDKQRMLTFGCSWSYNTPSNAGKLTYCANAWYWYQICMNRLVYYRSDDIQEYACWINRGYSIFHMTPCISHRPISGLDQYQPLTNISPRDFGLQADIGVSCWYRVYNGKGMYYSLYIQHVYASNNAVFSTLTLWDPLVTDRKINQQNKLEQAFITPSIFPYVILFSFFL